MRPFQRRFGGGFRVDSLRFVDFRESILAYFLSTFRKCLGTRAFREFGARDAAMLASGNGRNCVIGLNMRSLASMAATGPARRTRVGSVAVVWKSPAKIVAATVSKAHDSWSFMAWPPFLDLIDARRWALNEAVCSTRA